MTVAVKPLIAYVEDDDVIRQNFTELFEKDGYKVEAISSYESALASFESINPDIFILDIELGDRARGGLDLCQMVRRRLPDRPIILLTSHDQLELQTKGWELGADDYVPKDISLKLILVRIRTLISRYQMLTFHIKNDEKLSNNVDI